MEMEAKVRDLSVGELRYLLSDIIKESLGELIEDVIALSSQEYLISIEEARSDYKQGRVKSLEELFDVSSSINK